VEVGRSSDTRGVAIDAKSNILVTGTRRDNNFDEAFFALRFIPQGELDTSYGVNGGQFVDFGEEVDSLFVASALLDNEDSLVILGQKLVFKPDPEPTVFDIVLTRIR
jgi:hypothetical protein